MHTATKAILVEALLRRRHAVHGEATGRHVSAVGSHEVFGPLW